MATNTHQSAAATLSAKRAELRQAELELARAVEHYETAEAANAEHRVDILRRFVHRLEAATAAEREQEATEAAAAWLKENTGNTAVLKQIAAARQRAEEAIAVAVTAVEQEAKLYEGAGAGALARLILTARFPDAAKDVGPAVELPALRDYGGMVLRAQERIEKAFFGSQARYVLTPVIRACDRGTPREAEAKREAVQQWFDRNGGRLLPEAKTILDAAPRVKLPEPEGDGERERREQAERRVDGIDLAARGRKA